MVEADAQTTTTANRSPSFLAGAYWFATRTVITTNYTERDIAQYVDLDGCESF